MKKIICALIVVATLSGVSVSASAVEIRGYRSCGEWIAYFDRTNSQITSPMSWLVGFLSGMEVARNQNALKGTDNESIQLWMTNYCRANPLKDIADGGVDLYRELLIRKGIK